MGTYSPNRLRRNRHLPVTRHSVLDHPLHRDPSCDSGHWDCRGQVVLSVQLPFAVIPLVQFSGKRAKMGAFVNSRLTTAVAWVVTAAILFFNGELLWLIFRGT